MRTFQALLSPSTETDGVGGGRTDVLFTGANRLQNNTSPKPSMQEEMGKMEIVLTEFGTHLGKSGDRFVIKRPN